MIANPGKFKAILLSKNNTETVGIQFQIREKVIYSSDKVDLLGVAIDDQLNFESHISRFVARQLDNLTLSNAWASTFVLSLERFLLAPSFFKTLITALSSGIFQQQNGFKKLKKFGKGFSELLTMIMKLTIHHE